jgi:hypothetical protein
MKVRPAGTSIWVFLAGFLAFPLALAAAQRPSDRLETLTVPQDRLPTGCRLKPVAPPPVLSNSSQGSRVVVTGSSGPSFPTNPYIGRERQAMAAIRRMVDGTPVQPDGPAFDRRQAAEYQLRWAEGVAEAYRATYLWSDGSEVDVSAVRFEDEKLAGATPPQGVLFSVAGTTSRIVMGPNVVMVSARSGTNSCFETIRDHIQSLR